MTLTDVFVASGGGATALAVAGGLIARQCAHFFRRVAAEVVTDAVKELQADITKRFDANDAATQGAKDKAASLEVELAKQFGGNGNGVRQAINQLQHDLGVVQGVMSQLTQPAVVLNPNHAAEGNK